MHFLKIYHQVHHIFSYSRVCDIIIVSEARLMNSNMHTLHYVVLSLYSTLNNYCSRSNIRIGTQVRYKVYLSLHTLHTCTCNPLGALQKCVRA